MQCVLQTWERNIGSDRCKEREGIGNQTYRGGRSTSSFFFSVLANIAESYPLKGRKCASRWEEAWKKKNDNKKTWIARIATIFRATISKLGEISLFSCKNKRALLIAYVIEIWVECVKTKEKNFREINMSHYKLELSLHRSLQFCYHSLHISCGNDHFTIDY